MRVLLVSEDVPAPILGGLGKHVSRVGNALLKAGHQVTLMGVADHSYESCRAEVGFDGEFVAGFSLRGTGWKESKLGTFIPYKRLAIAKRIAHAIVTHAARFDVVHYHGHYPMVGAYVPATINFLQTRHDQGSECLTAFRFKAGEICTSTDPRDCSGCALAARDGYLQRSLASWAVQQYREEVQVAFARHTTIFVSDFLKDAYLRTVRQRDTSRLEVVHNFIDTRPLPHPVHADPRRLLFMGRLDAAKGLAEFLKHWVPKMQEGDSIEILGDGPQRAQCEALYANEAVVFRGWRLQADVLNAAARTGSVVVPSVWEEPFGQTTLEGLALCKPVHALHRGGTPELKRYERWPGQLQLYPDMASLVQGVLRAEQADRPELFSTPFKANVDSHLPRLLSLYAS